MKITTCFLAVFFIACSLLAAPSSHSGTYESSVWKGTITVTYREAGGDKSSSTSNQIHHEKQWSFSNTSAVTINVCGNSLEQGYVQKANTDYLHTWKSSDVHQKSICQPRGEIKRPGSKSSDEGQLSAIVHPDLVGMSVKASLSVTLQPQGGFRYIIAGGLPHDVPIALIKGSSKSTGYDPCENSTTTHTQELKVGAKESTLNCTNEGRACRSVVPATPLVLPMTFTHTGTTKGDRISGSKTFPVEKLGEDTLKALGTQLEEIARHLPPEVREEMLHEARNIKGGSSEDKKDLTIPDEKKGKTTKTITASWDIGRRNPCDDVIDQLRQELSMIQAYADANLVSRARREGWSGEEYDDAAFEDGKSRYASGWWKGPSSGSHSGYSGNRPKGDRRGHIDMALNSKNCSIEGQDEKRKALEQDCVPQVVYDSILEHEKTHAKQCMSERTAEEFASRTPDSFRKFEQAAYCVGAKKLLNWAYGVCKESDVKPLRDAYYTYCPK